MIIATVLSFSMLSEYLFTFKIPSDIHLQNNAAKPITQEVLLGIPWLLQTCSSFPGLLSLFLRKCKQIKNKR